MNTEQSQVTIDVTGERASVHATLPITQNICGSAQIHQPNGGLSMVIWSMTATHFLPMAIFHQQAPQAPQEPLRLPHDGAVHQAHRVVIPVAPAAQEVRAPVPTTPEARPPPAACSAPSQPRRHCHPTLRGHHVRPHNLNGLLNEADRSPRRRTMDGPWSRLDRTWEPLAADALPTINSVVRRFGGFSLA
ncbi:unnamed protein product [Sphagnum balticum]